MAKTKTKKFDSEQVLLKKRQVFLYDHIDECTTFNVVENILALDFHKTAPIVLWINSRGGLLDSAFLLMDIIQRIDSEVKTLICGIAASSAGIISLAGKERWMTKHSVWMAHDIWYGKSDDVTKQLYTAEYLKKRQKQIFDYIAERTKLDKKELEVAKHGELWLNAEECLEKGIVDRVVE